jgi:hypothetical protein
MNYLEIAKSRRNASKEVDYTLPLIEFISWCYAYLTPASYGTQLQKYICHILLNLVEMDKELALGDFSLGKQSGEFKSTYLSKDNNYSLTHLRQWQSFSYYIFCFIDCDNDFEPEFYFITKEDLSKFKLDNMSGTKKENKNQNNREKRLSIRKNSIKHKELKAYNLLGGTSYDDLKKYIDNYLKND